MQTLVQQLVAGLANGAIYASLALALVLVNRTTGVINFAQGEMAMVSTYIAWALIGAGMNYALAVAIAVAAAFAGGIAVERALIARVARSEHINVVIVMLGLLIVLNAIAGWIWGYTPKGFPTPFAGTFNLNGITFAWHQLAMVAMLGIVVVALQALLLRTPIGLRMRAAAINPDSARLVGIDPGAMMALGWGLAAVIGAIAGVMIAPVTLLEPNMMAAVIIYAFAAAILGGIDSFAGAAIGGLIVGVAEVLAVTYVPGIGGQLRMVVALVLIFAVLLVRPNGLFGRASGARV
jgi:branched-chain amino acid transport system permease protein